MQRTIIRNLLLVVVLLLGGSLTIVHFATVRAASSERAVLQDQIVPLLQHTQLLQPAATQQSLHLSIGLQLRNQDQLDALLASMYDPQSDHYHQFLTPDQFAQEFAPTDDQVQAVTSYLQSQGFTVQSVSSNNLLIDATANVGQAQRAFATRINLYQGVNHTFYANESAPSVPGSIGQLISSIGGLDNNLQYVPHYQLSLQRAQQSAQALTGPAGGLTPSELRGAYDIQRLHNSGILGDNQSIGLFELDGYSPADVQHYFQNYGLSVPNINQVHVGSATGAAGQGALEAELDIEVLAAVAPHATQVVYEGPNTTQGINDTYNRIVTENRVQIASISWGLCEASAGNAELQTLHHIFQQGAAEGITFVAAAGDSGAYDCQDSNLAVDSPADDPFVTGVGGTTLQLNGTSYAGESVWSDPGQKQHGPMGSGSGGGISSVFQQPGWQNIPGVSQYGSGNRKVPDVSAVADPSRDGYSVYCTVTNAGCPASGWLSTGGTSAAAPLWAGGLALVNQYLQSNDLPRMGQANPVLYAQAHNSQDFHDIISGNNLHYQATPGYDAASGIGSPDFYNLAHDLVAARTVLAPGPTPLPLTTPTSTPPPVQATPALASNLIGNGDFESGQGSPWQESSSQGYEMVDTTNAYSGQYSAYFCGYSGCDDRLWQTFALPPAFGTLTIRYAWYSDTTRTGNQCQDTFVSRLQTVDGRSIRQLQRNCNYDATNQWVQESYVIPANALGPYLGQQIILLFEGTSAPDQQISDFYVDNVVVQVG